MWGDVAYGPYGEIYGPNSGTYTFAGQIQEHTFNNLYRFMYREYGTQGRWPSPDPAGMAAANPANPQSWNRYAYVTNNPLASIDPSGLVRTPWGYVGPDPAEEEEGGWSEWTLMGINFYTTSIGWMQDPSDPEAITLGLYFTDVDSLLSLLDVPSPTGLPQNPNANGPNSPQASSPPQPQKQCLDYFNNSPGGELFNFFSLASPFIGPNQLESTIEDTAGVSVKYAGYHAVKYSADNDIALPELSSFLADGIPWVAREVVLPVSLAATAGQIVGHIACSAAPQF